MRKIALLLFLCCYFISPVYAWNANGHKVIAQIAYDNLTPQAKQAVNNLTVVVGHYYKINNFVDGAPWADWLKTYNITAYNTWHYINQPIVQGGCNHCTIPASSPIPNVVWAIQQAELVLSTPKSSQYPQGSDFGKSMFLLFLVHFVGDLHQPLHAANLYSNAYPNGDNGGNFFLLKGNYAENLHQYWDAGDNLFPQTHLSKEKIQLLAKTIEEVYPENSLLEQSNDLNPLNWAQESKALAKNTVYTLAPNSVPTAAYTKTTYTLAERQTALAGYRLAKVLNNIFD